MDITELHKRVHHHITTGDNTERTTDAVMWVVRSALADEAAKVERHRAKLDKLRTLHVKVDGGVFVDKCSCKGPWPCPTAELLEEA